MRLYIYTKDVQVITGKSPNTVRKLIKTIKSALSKTDDKPLTIREFCEYEQIEFNYVNSIINNIKQ